MKNVVCPKCGGALVYEELCQYGVQYKVGKNGKLSKRTKKVNHGSIDAAILFCSECNTCIDEDNFFFDSGRIELEGDEDETD